MKKTVIGIIAHVDSGKTTLSEAMLYLSGKIRKVGRVDHGDAFLDTDLYHGDEGAIRQLVSRKCPWWCNIHGSI